MNVNGCVNVGVNCHFNSLVQSLLGCSTFCEKVLQQPATNKVVEIMKSIINHNMTKNSESFTAYPLLHAVQEVLKQENSISTFGSSQEDAHEGFHLLIDSMKSKAIENLFKIKHRQDIYCPTCDKIVSNSINEDIFMEINPNVSLYNPDKTKSPFENYIHQNIRNVDDFRCEQCNIKQKCKKIYRITYAPPIIVLTLIKYDNKISIDAPDTISLNGIGTKLIYTRVSQIEHSGGRNSGHYIAISQRRDGIYNFNDMSCNKTIFQSTGDTYMIFYQHTA